MTSNTAMGAPADATPALRPRSTILEGRVVDVVPLDPVAHADSLFDSTRGEENESLWLYLFEGPFPTRGFV